MAEEKRKPRYGGNKRPRFQKRRDGRRRYNSDKNIKEMISKIEEKLSDAIRPESVSGLNSFERKLIHRHFDHSSAFETRTYRNGEKFTLYVYPVGNIEKFAREKASESLETGLSVDLPPMGSYERYLVHNALKDFAGVETSSIGEGDERYIQIVSKKFGRGLKRIAKKIKLF